MVEIVEFIPCPKMDFNLKRMEEGLIRAIRDAFYVDEIYLVSQRRRR